ncbi:MAG: amino acid adenylation domain-containing protein [Microcystis aeruginosa Ma_QC_Ch_20071001_S25]|uniref:Amino acid adenylation domain-containing protein n=1 Tax=Microcystis aeruginosa Ma_QC_Ch_20071001_S25D TaxID=2486250 RepID=A0A552FS81_MICAE|nr:MAG: amino acid adenylation domain-containing protein [Microcystis aeruginosa Ma_QC_Ch_20071001_S25]TRU49592.1 MAG: amino acid adenylation domain-containing protein [Microcystis aeruginosa Ma_QC_Ch_20071001_S25D]TRU60872.1 MAG: amino acid adenylation domain-containing protein [Microcystis aeruginosa Ma_QC_Ch_20071001_M135]
MSRNIETIYPSSSGLSRGQEAMWLIYQIASESVAYNIFITAKIYSYLKIPVVNRVWQKIIEKHPILRTTYTSHEGKPVQQVNQQLNFSVGVIDASEWSEDHLREKIYAIADTPFNLEKDSVLRVNLFTLSPEDHILLLTMHHIAGDMWSFNLLLGEFQTSYTNEIKRISQGQPETVDSLSEKKSYADFVHWQSEMLSGSKGEKQWQYWQKQLAGELPILNLLPDKPRPPVKTYEGASYIVKLDEQLIEKLKHLALATGTTLYRILLTVFYVQLYRYTNQTDILIGSPMRGRTGKEFKEIVGYFSNLTVLRVFVEENATFTELLAQVSKIVRQAQKHQDYPFSLLVEKLQPQRDPSRSPFCQVSFTWQAQTWCEQKENLSPSQEPMLQMAPYLLGHQRGADFDLSLMVMEAAETFQLNWQYNTDLFEDTTITPMAGHFVTLLESIVENPQQPVSLLPLLTQREQHQLLVEWNNTKAEYPSNKCIHQLFEEQVERTPDAVAVVFEGQQLTYNELNCRANQLAHYLQSLGVKPDTLVGICVERSLEMIVGLLGILKASGAYVPLDPDYPIERIIFMLEDAAVKVLLTQQKLINKLPEHQAQLICLDADWELISQFSQDNPITDVQATNLAYVIYTSGSTGQPKGVMLSHSNLSNHMFWMQETFPLTKTDRVLQKTPFSFDASVWEFYAPLLVGGQLLIAQPGGHTDSDYLLKTIAQQQVTTVQLVPSLLQMLLEQGGIENCQLLKRVFCGGEILPVALQEKLLSQLNVNLCNLYGPTECCIDVTFWNCQREMYGQRIPIGRPISNTQIYILDSNLQSLPVGIPGELHIGGAGLARGYLNRPELTEEKFIPNPFSNSPDSRLYKTGDLARYLPDGNIEYLGRIDNQVKIRGFRIELGEVEAVLTQCPQVQSSVIIAREDTPGNKRLVAYIVPEKETTPTPSEMRQFLKEKLPEYMIPSAFVILESLPLTPNGKIDRRALPAPEQNHERTDKFIAPRNPIEEILVTIWTEVLKVQQISINDNFFELGGDSILSISIISKAKQAGLEITLKQLFAHQTIAELAIVTGTANAVLREQGLVTGTVPLTPIQHWFFEQKLAEKHHFNQAFLLSIPSHFQPEILKKVFEQLIKHHDALRLRFRETESGWQQIHSSPTDSIAFSLIDLSTVPEREQQAAIENTANQLQASLNLSENLVQVAYFSLGSKLGARLLIVIHHLVVDGVSWRILLEDLQTAYQLLNQGQTLQLPAKTTSFKDWSQRLTKLAQSEELKSELSYWLNNSNSSIPSLPVDYPEGVNTIASASQIVVSLNATETQALLQDVPQAYKTQINDVLLTALVLVLAKWTNSKSVLFNLEGHGREDIINGVDLGVDLSRTVGWFTTIFPVIIHLDSLDNFSQIPDNLGQILKAVKEQLRAIPNKGIGYGLLRYLKVDEEICQQLERVKEAEISFNYLGQFSQVFSQSSAIQLAPESSGQTCSLQGERSQLLDINAIITHEKLQIDWTYSKNIHRQETVENLAQEFVETLRAIITHCLLPESGGYTPTDFPLTKIHQLELDKVLANLALKSELGTTNWRNVEDIYPLSPMQEGMLFESLLKPDSGVYFEQMICTFTGNLDVSIFEKAWQQIITKYSIFRTGFLWESLSQPLQVVYKQINVTVKTDDWRSLSEEEQQQQLEDFLAADRQQGFPLDQAPLMRLNLFRLGENSYQFVWSHHHLLIDGWSLPLVFKDLLEFYQTLAQGHSLSEQPTVNYRHYIAWLQRQNQEAAKEFWRQKLQGFTAPTPLRIDQLLPRGERGKISYGEEEIKLTVAATAAAQSFVKKHQLTLNNLVQVTWGLLLSRYSGENDVVFGATVSGRPPKLVGVESMVGLFINTLPVRVQISSETELLGLLKDLQTQQVESEQFSYSPLVEIQGLSDVPRGTSLFDSIVVFENYPVDTQVLEDNSNLIISNFCGVEQTNYPLTVAVIPGEQLLVRMSYDGSRFEQDTINRMLSHFVTLLEGIIANPSERISQLPLLTKVEEQQLLIDWNNTEVDYPSKQCIHQLFEEQVERTPDAVAVVFEGQQLTYNELNCRANQLAHYLQSLGVKPDQLVGICLERSLEMIVGLLGILKAGGAYVPLDPEYPIERLSFMLEDAQLSVLLTQQKLGETLPQHQAQIIYLDSDWEKIAENSHSNLENTVTPDNLAYVIYTSGSTGKPKGVLVNHSNVVRLFAATDAWYNFNSQDVWSLFHSYAFDFSVWEMWGALLYGGRLVVVSYLITRSPEAFYQLLCQEKVTILNQTPTAFRQLIQAEESLKGSFPLSRGDRSSTTDNDLSLRLVIFGGEALEINSLQPWFQRHGDQCPQLVNMYGITETTVHVTYRPLSMTDLDSTASVIGRPIPDLQVYLLDQYLQLVPVGVPGEMYVGGAGVTKGYLNRPELTKERFISSPFEKDEVIPPTPLNKGGNEPSKLYKTGDLARYLPKGELEYLGRIDNQVKIRGFRIELGEIEALLASHPQIWETVVIVRDDATGDKRLVAYIVPQSEKTITINEIRQFLKAQLPGYMIPNAFVILDALPLTANGKIDSRALPPPESSSEPSDKYVAPRTPIEDILVTVWSEVLKVEKVGINDNFFELGGHSLLATKLVAQIRDRLKVELPLRQLFNSATLAELAQGIEQLKQQKSDTIVPAILPRKRK